MISGGGVDEDTVGQCDGIAGNGSATGWGHGGADVSWGWRATGIGWDRVGGAGIVGKACDSGGGAWGSHGEIV